MSEHNPLGDYQKAEQRDELMTTNRRLNRRCQKAESMARYYERRFEAIQKPMYDATERLMGYTRRLKMYTDATHANLYNYCSFCHWKFRFKQWVRRW